MQHYDWAKMHVRDRDALVAEKVFGHRVIREKRPNGQLFINEAGRVLPSYSSDISAAWEVFQAFTQAWVGYQGTDYACEITDGIGDEARTGRASYDDDHVNACECICLAALRAKGVDV